MLKVHPLDEIQQKLSKLMLLVEKMGVPYFGHEIEELQKKLLDQSFYVVVVGLFKRGKSSLINSLLGVELAPVSVTPLTSVITIFKYGERPHAEVVFKNGEKKEVDTKVIDDYISEELNPNNIKAVSSVILFHNVPLLREIVLIDTPGLGSVYEHNTETTLQFISKIDVALLVLSADTPISKTDIDFLQRMKVTVPRFLFVLNKSDLLPAADISKMIAYNSKIIAETLGKNEEAVEILPVSSKSYQDILLENGIRRLYKTLETLSQTEKDKILALSTETQFHLLKQQITGMLQLQIDTLMMPANMLEQTYQSFQASRELMLKNKYEFENIIKLKIKQIDTIVHNTIIDEAKIIQTDINDLITQKIAESLSTKSEKNTLKEELDTIIISRFREAKNKMEISIKNQFKDLLREHSERSQNFLNELTRQLSSLMNIDLNAIAGKFDLNVYTSFYLTLNIGESPINYSDWLSPFLNSTQKKERQKKRWQQHYHEIIITNNAAVIYDLQYKAQEALRKFNYDLNQDFEQLLLNIEGIIQNTLRQKSDSSFVNEKEIESLQQIMQDMNSM
jgi:small GTP-binding protein